MYTYRISQEWAKQIVFDAFGNKLDFARMKVMYIPDGFIPVCRVACERDSGFREQDYCEEIKIEKYADFLNREITIMGYGRKTNTIVVGESRLYEKEF